MDFSRGGPHGGNAHGRVSLMRVSLRLRLSILFLVCRRGRAGSAG
ncbi:hypothetical protein BURMUCF2_2410 [Burkholderia multivorans CF2]|nr:hypothetical protein BURMUCF2_2410 [Burkholderia multivorans CF2]